jgi:hypothetical protein
VEQAIIESVALALSETSGIAASPITVVLWASQSTFYFTDYTGLKLIPDLFLGKLVTVMGES